jgi:uncharacterized protein YuzE
MANNKMELKISQDEDGEGDVAYLSMPDHPGRGIPGVTNKTVRLLDIHPGYKGADIYFDFDKDDKLIGIEILT